MISPGASAPAAAFEEANGRTALFADGCQAFAPSGSLLGQWPVHLPGALLPRRTPRPQALLSYERTSLANLRRSHLYRHLFQYAQQLHQVSYKDSQQ